MTPRARKTPARQAGFTFIEVLIVFAILGVLAALVMPQFSVGSTHGKAGSLRYELGELRTQIMVYRAQHEGRSPGYLPDAPRNPASAAAEFQLFVEQLTRFSNAKGQTSPVASPYFPFGPYLTRMPLNGVNGSARVRFVPHGEPFPTEPHGPEGWVYQPDTGMIAANAVGQDFTGAAYFDY